jgi:hypothetical protein
LSEIFLAELSGDHIKVGTTRGNVSERVEPRGRILQGDVESGSKWTVAGNRRMLVAGKSSTAPHVGITDRQKYLVQR